MSDNKQDKPQGSSTEEKSLGGIGGLRPGANQTGNTPSQGQTSTTTKKK